MQGNYLNWMPKRYIKLLKSFQIILHVLCVVSLIYLGVTVSRGDNPFWIILMSLVLVVGDVILTRYDDQAKRMRKAFDFSDDNSISWRLLNDIVNRLAVKDSDRILDVGCGSGALSNLVAINYPQNEVVGCDIFTTSNFGYKEFTKDLCEKNAAREGLNNVSFFKEDARNLSYEDESFDVVVSNYVFHNIPNKSKQALFEALRVLRKGGNFVIRDIFTESHYGDLNLLVKQIKDMGFVDVQLIDDKEELFVPYHKHQIMLDGSKVLVGKK